MVLFTYLNLKMGQFLPKHNIGVRLWSYLVEGYLWGLHKKLQIINKQTNQKIPFSFCFHGYVLLLPDIFKLFFGLLHSQVEILAGQVTINSNEQFILDELCAASIPHIWPFTGHQDPLDKGIWAWYAEGKWNDPENVGHFVLSYIATHF